jgi:hypothetical protein
LRNIIGKVNTEKLLEDKKRLVKHYLELVNDGVNGINRFYWATKKGDEVINNDNKDYVPGYCAACFQRLGGAKMSGSNPAVASNGGGGEMGRRYRDHPCTLNSEIMSENRLPIIIAGEPRVCLANSKSFGEHLSEKAKSLTDGQKVAVDKVLGIRDKNFLIVGRAGTGKSHLAKFLVNCWDRRSCDVRALSVVTPTNSAAAIVGGKTLHSYFGLSIRKDKMLQNYYYKNMMVEFSKLVHTIVEDVKAREIQRRSFQMLEYLLLDEIFLLSSSSLTFVDMFLMEIRSAWGFPFGGVQVVCVGDAQLVPSVSKDNKEPILPSDSFFFGAKAYGNGKFSKLTLTQTMRQDNPEFIAQLQLLQMGGSEIPEVNLELIVTINSTYGSSIPSESVDLANAARIMYLTTDLKLTNKLQRQWVLPERVNLKMSPRIFARRQCIPPVQAGSESAVVLYVVTDNKQVIYLIINCDFTAFNINEILLSKLLFALSF